MSIPTPFNPLGTLGSGLPPLPAGWRHVESVFIPRAGTRTVVFQYSITDPGTPAEEFDITLHADMEPLVAQRNETDPVVVGNVFTRGQAPGLWCGYYDSWGGWKVGVTFDAYYHPNTSFSKIGEQCPVLGTMKDGIVSNTVNGQLKTVDLRGKVSVSGRKHQFSVFRDENENVTLYRCEFKSPHHKTVFYPVHNDSTGQDGVYELYKKTVYPIL